MNYDLWLRMAENAAQFARLPQTLLYWRDHLHRQTRTTKFFPPDAFRKGKSHFLSRGILAEIDSVWIWGIGPEGKIWRKLLRDKGIEVTGWIDVDRKKIGQPLHGDMIIGPGQIPKSHPLILVCVGAKGARQKIKDFCQSRDLSEGEDYLCVT